MSLIFIPVAVGLCWWPTSPIGLLGQPLEVLWYGGDYPRPCFTGHAYVYYQTRIWWEVARVGHQTYGGRLSWGSIEAKIANSILRTTITRQEMASMLSTALSEGISDSSLTRNCTWKIPQLTGIASGWPRMYVFLIVSRAAYWSYPCCNLFLGELGCESDLREQQEIYRARNDQIRCILYDQDIEESRDRLSGDEWRISTHPVRTCERDCEHRLWVSSILNCDVANGMYSDVYPCTGEIGPCSCPPWCHC